MLKILRRKGVSKKILWVIAIIIILSFGFFGTAYLLTGQRKIANAGIIFGTNVTYPTYEAAYRDVRVQALISHGEQFNQYINSRDLDADTWDRLILLHEAGRRRIKVSDEEVISVIQRYKFFQRDGQFDNLLYRDIVQYVFKVPARTFEEIIRDSIKISKLFAQETFTASVDENEIRDAFNRQNERVQVSYVLISPEQYMKEADFDESSAKKFYEENKSLFMIPQSINVDYLFFPYTGEMAKNAADPEKITEMMKEAQEKSQKVAEELKDNPNFEEVAKNNNMEIKSSGFFSIEKPNLSLGMSYDLLNQLFELRKGEISKPVETSNGYFIVKVADKKQSYIPDYDEAREAVKEAIQKQEAMAIAQEKAKEILPKLKEEYNKVLPLNFVNAAKSLSLVIEQTPAFNRGQYLPKIGISRDFQEAAFTLSKENPISDVVATPNGYCILHMDDYIPAGDKEFNEQKDQIASLLLNSKRFEIFGEFTSRLRLESNLIDNVSRLKEEQSRT